ncbi:site-specific integrase [uncultured Kordia sp.]|uniref:tyrosine-type recombinase/integrase n=1 Tax=uncultured Kordia sp. TaxID=507699 RepID=UPI00261A0B16|nr:site-specific integrase [uncultured Kordia sp.]
MQKHTISSNNRPKVDKYVDKLKRHSQKNSSKTSIILSNLAIEKLKPLPVNTIYWFRGLNGFGIRISPKGIRTWIVQYRVENKNKRMSIGRYPQMSLNEARKRHTDIKFIVEFGGDPLEEKRLIRKNKKDDKTVSYLLDLYVEHSKKAGKKTYKNEYYIIRNGLGDELLQKPIAQITPREISNAVRAKINNGKPSAARHLLKYTKRLFNYGAGLFLLEQNNNPCIGLKVDVPKRKRQRHLSPKEIYKFWHGLEKLPVSPSLILAIKFLLCTASRSVEVRNMQWDDVDPYSRVWTMPTSKNGRMHRVHLSNLAMTLIDEVKQYTGHSDWVFGSARYNGRCQIIDKTIKPFKVWTLSQVFRRHFKKFQISKEFYPHDLRRTGATIVAGLFGRRDFASLLLNHTMSDVTGIYDHYSYDKEKKMAINALNKAIEIIIKSPNVESVPSFEQLREKVFNKANHSTVDTKQDFQASFSNPVSYTLSYIHDG